MILRELRRSIVNLRMMSSQRSRSSKCFLRKISRNRPLSLFYAVLSYSAFIGDIMRPRTALNDFEEDSGGQLPMGRTATIAIPLAAVVFVTLIIECPATIVHHHCCQRTVRRDVRWGWARHDNSIFPTSVQYMKSPIWSPWLDVQPSLGEHRRGSGRISLTTLERPTKLAKLDLIAGILLIFVVDMLLLSFTF